MDRSSKDQILTEYYSQQENGGVAVKVVAAVNRDTQYVDGTPLEGFSVQLALDYDLPGLQKTQTRLLMGEEDLLAIGQSIIGAVYLLRAARKRAESGRDDPFRRIGSVARLEKSVLEDEDREMPMVKI